MLFHIIHVHILLFCLIFPCCIRPKIGTFAITFLPKVITIYKDASGFIAQRVSDSKLSQSDLSRQANMRGIKELSQQPIRLMDRATLRSYVNLLERELNLARAALSTLDVNEGVAIGNLPQGHTAPTPTAGGASGAQSSTGGYQVSSSPQLGAMATPTGGLQRSGSGNNNVANNGNNKGNNGTGSTLKRVSSAGFKSPAALVQRNTATVSPAPATGTGISTGAPPSPNLGPETRFRLPGFTPTNNAGSTTITTTTSGGTTVLGVRSPSRTGSLQIGAAASSLPSSPPQSVFHSLQSHNGGTPLVDSLPPQSHSYILGARLQSGGVGTSTSTMSTDQPSPSASPAQQQNWTLDRSGVALTSGIQPTSSPSPANNMMRAPLLVTAPASSTPLNGTVNIAATLQLHQRPSNAGVTATSSNTVLTAASPSHNDRSLPTVGVDTNTTTSLASFSKKGASLNNSIPDEIDALLPHTVPEASEISISAV
jgi:hypothetical protein